MHHAAGGKTVGTDMQVVFHADDLGLNRAVTDGILRGFTHGLLTSASLLANGPDAARALRAWRQLQRDAEAGRLPSAAARRTLGEPPRGFDLGVHLNLTQGRPLGGDRYPRELLDAGGRFPGICALFRRLRGRCVALRPAVKEELSSQVQAVLAQGLQPTHLNGHQYIEMLPGVAEIVAELLPHYGIKVIRVAAERPELPTALCGGVSWPQWALGHVKQAYARRFRRRMDRLGVAHPDQFFGTMHAGRVDLPALRRFLRPRRGIRLVEIAMHPAEAATADDPQYQRDGWYDPLSALRPNELRTLLADELLQHLHRQRLQLGRLSELAAPRVRERDAA